MIISGAVLTADMVNSTAMGAAAASSLATRLQEIINANQAKFLSFYRGDSFQSYLIDPFPAFRLALMLRTEAILFSDSLPNVSTDLKVSIGIGTINTPVVNISQAQGQAFILSGRGLDTLEKSGQRLLMQTENAAANNALAAISLFIDYLFAQLTTKQAEVLQYLLQGRTQIETAKILNKSQSTINRHVQSLGWLQIEQLITLYNQTIQSNG